MALLTTAFGSSLLTSGANTVVIVLPALGKSREHKPPPGCPISWLVQLTGLEKILSESMLSPRSEDKQVGHLFTKSPSSPYPHVQYFLPIVALEMVALQGHVSDFSFSPLKDELLKS